MNPIPRWRPRREEHEPSNARGSLMNQQRKMRIVRDISSMKYQTSGHRTDLYRHVCWRTVQEQSKIVIEVQQQNPDCSGPPRQGRRNINVKLREQKERLNNAREDVVKSVGVLDSYCTRILICTVRRKSPESYYLFLWCWDVTPRLHNRKLMP